MRDRDELQGVLRAAQETARAASDLADALAAYARARGDGGRDGEADELTAEAAVSSAKAVFRLEDALAAGGDPHDSLRVALASLDAATSALTRARAALERASPATDARAW